MEYISTRGQAPEASFCEILLAGLAPDGGLYVPKEYPTITPDELTHMRGMSPPMIIFRILRKFIDDIPANDLWHMVRSTFTPETFRYCRPGRNASDITPLVPLEPGLYLQELSNGPTLAFKDFAMQPLGKLFEYVLTKRNETINILGATSGDTGSAAEYAFRGKKGIRVFMLSPHGKMSAFQRAQMYSLSDSNIFNIAIEGMFDDGQDIVKALSGDKEFKLRYKLGAVNSINLARVMIQSCYYVLGWLAATKTNDEVVDFAVPTGNFGNICAGHIARMMGLPIRQLVLATNENNVLDEFFRTGVYRPRNTADVAITSSPSMDISKASNFERFIFDLVGRDAAIVRQLWRQVDVGSSFSLADGPFAARLPDYGIVSGSSTHSNRVDAIRKMWSQHDVMIDPHTADAYHVGMMYRGPNVPMIILETAQPAKFEDTIREALGRDPVRPAELEGIENLLQHVEVMPVDAGMVRRFIETTCSGG